MKNRALSIFLIISGFLLAAAGLCRGETGQVLLKGIRVCLECIGIG